MTDMTTPLSSCCGEPMILSEDGNSWHGCTGCYPIKQDVIGVEVSGTVSRRMVDKETPKPDSEGCLPGVTEAQLHEIARAVNEEQAACYSIYTDEERRQTYDYKMGYREGMAREREEIGGMVDEIKKIEAEWELSVDETIRQKGWNSALKAILRLIDERGK